MSAESELLLHLLPRDEARALIRVGRAFTSGGEAPPSLALPPPGELFPLPAEAVKPLFRERAVVLRSLLGSLEAEHDALEAALCGGGDGEVEAAPFGGGGEEGGGGAHSLVGGGAAAPALGRAIGVSPLLAKQSQLYLCFRAAAARLEAKKAALVSSAAGDDGAAVAAEDAAARARRGGGGGGGGADARATRALAQHSPAALNSAARRLREGRRAVAEAADAAATRATATAAALARVCALREEDAERSREAVQALWSA
jgi:hypothetical protein